MNVYYWLMAEGTRATDSPSWWTGEGTDLLNSDDTFKYPPELLGTSWGSYLFSVPPTAHGGHSGRKVVIADTSVNSDNGTSQRLSQKSSTKRGILRTPGRTTTAEPNQPHPLCQHLLAAIEEAQEHLTSCGIDASPLDHASATLKQKQSLHTGGGEECIERVLDALVDQSRKLQEHALTLHQTALMLAKNQKQFVKDQQQFKQMVESYITEQESQQLKRKTGKEVCLSKKNLQQNKKTYTMGLQEGQHKLALMQTRKEHLRLEKSLLQQQRDLRRLEQAYKTTTSDLAVMQYSFEKSQKKLNGSDLLLHKKRICGLKKKFNEYNQQLHHLVHQLETSKHELVETGSRLRLKEQEAHIPISTNRLAQEQSLSLPPIAKSQQQRNQHQPVNSTQFSLPLLNHYEVKTNESQQTKQNTAGQLSRLELMSLAKFRNPETAEQVISWLEKAGAVKLSDQ